MAPDFRIYQGLFDQDKNPMTSAAVYSASKAAVLGLSRYLASYWAPYDIRVNTLVPGGVEHKQPDQFKWNYSQRIPLGRMDKEEDMLGALLYLASDASAYVTGQEFFVDGGL